MPPLMARRSTPKTQGVTAADAGDDVHVEVKRSAT
jgi:hypothetical protein